MKTVVIIGAGGHGKVIADIVLKSGDRLLGFLDGAPVGEEFIGFPILGKDTDFRRFSEHCFIIAVGNAAIRERLANAMQGVQWYTAIHPTAVISGIDVSIGEGSVVMAGADINSGTSIGKHCIINTGSIVEHDNVIEDYVHISVGARLAGTVRIGTRTWIGIGASVSNNISVCRDCMLGAGAVVVRDISESGTYVGVPAVKIK